MMSRAGVVTRTAVTKNCISCACTDRRKSLRKSLLFPNHPNEVTSSGSASPKRRGVVSKCEHLHTKQACGHQSPVAKPCTAQTQIGNENSPSFVTEGDNNNHTHHVSYKCQDELRGISSRLACVPIESSAQHWDPVMERRLSKNETEGWRWRASHAWQLNERTEQFSWHPGVIEVGENDAGSTASRV